MKSCSRAERVRIGVEGAFDTLGSLSARLSSVLIDREYERTSPELDILLVKWVIMRVARQVA